MWLDKDQSEAKLELKIFDEQKAFLTVGIDICDRSIEEVEH